MKTYPDMLPMLWHRWFWRVVCALIAACVLEAMVPLAQAAENDKVNYEIPVGDAIDTLRQAAQQGGFQIMFPADTVRGVKTNAVRGEYTATEALNVMLAGTELFIVQDNKTGAISIQRVEPARRAPREGNPSSSQNQGDDSPIQLSAFEVSEDRSRGYHATSTTSATRLNTPIVELSKSIQIITRDMIDDLKVSELNESLYFSAAVSYTSQYSGRLAVRGFENAAAKRNGLGNYGSDESISDTVTIERIEVVKGPSSLLYGSSSPGGVVNYETKRPISYQKDSVRLMAGSFGKRRAELDSGGPLIGNGNGLNYRLVAAYDEDKSFGKYNGGRRNVVAGSLRWHITPDTYLMVGAELGHGERTNIRVSNYPISRSTFDADGNFVALHDHFDLSKTARDDWVGAFSGPYNRHDSSVKRYDADFSHKFNDQLNLFAHYSYIDNRLEEAYSLSTAEAWIQGTIRNPGRNEMNMQSSFRNPHRRSHNGTVTLNYDFKTDAIETQVIAGWEYYTFNLKQGDYAQNEPYWNLVNFVTVSGYEHPWANTFQGVLSGIAAGEWSILNRYNRTQSYDAPYLLVHSYLLDRRLRLIAGIRHDSVKIEQTFYGKDATSPDPFALTPPSYSTSEASATTPMVGVSFSPLKNNPGVAVFANYSESLVANEIVNPDGSNLPPENGEGVEVGVKLDIADRMSATLSWFTVDRTNLARGIPNTVPQEWEATGLQRSKGLDLDLFYALTPDWQLLVSATSINARYVSDGNTSLIGTRIPNVPKWSWSVWNKYSFATGTLKGFSVGGGVISRASTEVYGANYPGMVAPEFTRVDVLFGYESKLNGRDVEYSLKINNLFDKVYMDGARGFGEPRSVQASITVHF